MKATAKDLRFHSKALLDTVNRGEEVVITFRGRPCAKLVPYREKNEEIIQNKLFGIWNDSDMVQDADEYVRGLRKILATDPHRRTQTKPQRCKSLSASEPRRQG